MARFDPHGNTMITVTGSIVRVQPDGPGNAEEIERVLHLIAGVLPSMPAGRWAALLVADAETLITPEAETMLSASLPELAKSGHVAMAIAALNSSTRYVIESQFGRMYGRAGLRFAVFGNEEEAQAWLLAGLAV